MKFRFLTLYLLVTTFPACGSDTNGPSSVADVADVADMADEDTVSDTAVGDMAGSDTTVAPETIADALGDTPGDAVVFDDLSATDADVDSGPGDSGDAGDTTVGPTVPLPGFGAISGPCGFIDDELQDDAPSFEVNAIDFGDDPYDANDFERLTAAGQEIIRDGNAGGNSLYSEVFAAEVLVRCELATLIATETEIDYVTEGKITDFLAEIDMAYVGVSVVRAVGFPKDAPYTVEQATTILERKLNDILESSANVSAPFAWVKQILHVLAYSDQHVESLRTAWDMLPTATRADTIVIVTVTHGADAFMY